MKENTLISEVMTRYVITVSPNTTVDKVLEIFKNGQIHHLPVVSNDQLVGMISKIDVYKITHCIELFRSKSNKEFNDRLLESLLAEEIMTKEVVILSPNDTVMKAATLFSQNRYHAIPIVQDDKLVGILSTFDLVELAFNQNLKPAL
jgi:acetoin utilization protein AcuB